MSDGPASGAAALKSSASSQSGPDPLIGRVINDRFKVVAMLARGGMGKVYRAEQAPLGREVALKVLNPNYSGDQDPEFHKRFFLEAATCSKLTHPNTVTIFDYGRSEDDVYYIAMELLEGRTLHRALRDEGPFEPQRALHIARQIARSLREAHGLGVIHRDLKPANVYLVRHSDENDFVKVLDFGLVKNVDDKGEDLTQTGLFMGSPKYMSPEQVRGERADARADIYALGVILYEMLTHKVPFDRSSSVNILMAHVHETPPPFAVANPNVQVPAVLEAAVMRMLEKSPDGRYASMDEVLVALKNVTTDSGAAVLSTRHSIETGITGRFEAATEASQSGSGPQAAAISSSGAVSLPSPDVISTLPPKEAKQGPPVALIGGGVVVVALLAIGGWLLTREEPAPPPPPPPPVAEVTPPVVEPPVEEPPPPVDEPPPPARTTVSLTSEPDGASVSVGENEIGTTPVEIIWEGEDAEVGREVTFVFELSGYRDLTVTRTITGETLEVQATLERLPTPRPIRPRPPRDPAGAGEVTGGGYKTDPY